MLKLACLGVKSNVTKEQAATGIKDPYTQFWIEQLFSQAQELKNQNLSPTQIQDKLLHWVDEKMDAIRNGIFTLRGIGIGPVPVLVAFIDASIGFDPTQDSPIEILHTILLGVVKYVWHLSHTKWNEKQKSTYAVRLQAVNTDGLTIPSIHASYIMQYAGSLIGQQLKTVGQTNAFLTYDICDSKTFSLWKAVGELMALLWVPEIDDLEMYSVS